jgi:hypothetical protein
MTKPALIIIIILISLFVIYLIYYNNLAGFVGRRGSNYFNPYIYPVFNLGTRELLPTHLQSYDVRGDVPVMYYPNGSFYQPEWPYNSYYPPVIEPNFYTYDYVNPVQGFYPPIWNSNYSDVSSPIGAKS